MRKVHSAPAASARPDPPKDGARPFAPSMANPGSNEGVAFSTVCPENGNRHDEGTFIGLFETLEASLPKSSPKVVEFMGPKGGEGVTTLVHDFACCVTKRLRKAVLVIEGQPPEHPPGQGAKATPSPKRNREQHLRTAREAFGYGPAAGALVREPQAACPQRDGHSERAVHSFSDRELFIMRVPLSEITPLTLGRIIDGVAVQLNLVVIDASAPAPRAAGLAVARCVDGVLLVLDANTIDPIATQALISKLQEVGVKPLGMVLNRVASSSEVVVADGC